MKYGCQYSSCVSCMVNTVTGGGFKVDRCLAYLPTYLTYIAGPRV